MKKSVVQTLLIIVAAALVLLALTFSLQGVATANAQREHLRLMKTLLPGSENFAVEPYSGDDATIHSVHKGETGFVIETVTQGYADGITMLIGVSNEGKVTGLVIREMHETVGLGWNALTDWQFLSQFLNGEGDAEVGTMWMPLPALPSHPRPLPAASIPPWPLSPVRIQAPVPHHGEVESDER